MKPLFYFFLCLFMGGFIRGQAQNNALPLNGNVGIGTTSPAYKLHLVSPEATNFEIHGSHADWAGMSVRSTNATGQPFYGYFTNTNAKTGWHYMTPAGDWRLSLGGTDRFGVTSAGNAGIGTNTPASRLEVSAPSTAFLTMRYTTSTGAPIYGSTGINFNHNTTKLYSLEYFTWPDSPLAGFLQMTRASSGNGVYLGLNSIWFGNGPQTGGAVASTTNKFIFDGNIGIGSASPASRIEVAGSSPYVTLKSTGTTGSTGINLADNSGTQYAVYYSHAPAFGANGAHLEHKSTTNGIHVWSDQIWLGKLENPGVVPLSLNSPIYLNGRVGIGTSKLANGFRLTVEGKMIGEEVWVKLDENWPDYVFHAGYHLKSLEEVESYINENNHLPEVPSAAEIKNTGINTGHMHATLLKKVEELTLYLIEANKEIKRLSQEVEAMKAHEHNQK